MILPCVCILKLGYETRLLRGTDLSFVQVYPTVSKAARKIYAEEGASALVHGMKPTLLGIVPCVVSFSLIALPG